jgi:Mor family transcriptional regulator
VEELGGLQVHFPSLKTLENEIRDRAIRKAFRGDNYRELALEHNLTVRQKRRIVPMTCPQNIDADVKLYLHE